MNRDLQNNLIVREDDFSIQGTVANDSFVFLRRLSPPNGHIFSDVLFGQLSTDEASSLLAEFIQKSGGISFGPVEFLDVGAGKNEHDEIVARYDFIVDVMKSALGFLGLKSENSFLQPDGGKFKAIVEVSHSVH